MIFDCDYVTELTERWQKTNDPKLLELILDHSQSLVEAIVSGYDSFYREDLIQEVNLRIQYALPYFDRNIANLHTYLTTVSKNICLTYLNRQNKLSSELPLEIFEDIIPAVERSSNYVEMLEDLIIHNRQRFPSLPIDVIDDASEIICDFMAGGTNRRMLLGQLVSTLNIDRNIAQVVYTSSLIYLRSKYIGFANYDNDDEFSIHADLINVFGKTVGETISIIFSGMTIRFP